ncbi:RDD family protein [Luteimonas huabeiensis]|uniref:RDD family protein n=1 Tax=Luteimonas huabeiensis TaxID=1244513 RepID=UPI0004669655|nr:RDD family protein [Luteimonas huabeiensis]
MTATADRSAPPARPRPWIGWRLAALFYDLWPAVALWFVLGFVFALGYTFLGHHDPHENIAPFSGLQWLLWACCWIVTGLYATASWRRGGQTLGMRPWRLRAVAADGDAVGARAAWVRYAVGTVSLLAGGLGFWWAWFDRDRLTWHDRASGTRIVREPRSGVRGQGKAEGTRASR